MMELDPEVKSQLDVLNKAHEGLKAAKAMVEQAAAIIKLFPDDKTATRAKTEAERMVERFVKHVKAAQKIIGTLSKKTMPPALNKEADTAAKAIRAKLVDPEGLKVFPWQGMSILRDGGVEYQMRFQLKGDPKQFYGAWVLTLATGTAFGGATAKIESWENGHRNTSGARGQDFAARFLEALQGWDGIKGEDKATAARETTAKAIADALNSTIRAMRAHDTVEAKIGTSNLSVEAAYRSNLPKEGASDVGSYRYDEMVSDELARCRKVLDPKLSPYKNQIANVGLHDEEKSWIYITVRLK